MATRTSQRVGIWVIAIVMVVGTIGSFAIMILSTQNQNTDLQKQQAAQSEYQASVQKQADELSKKYYGEFKQYSNRTGTFVADDIKKVTTKDLKPGTGETIKDGTAYAAYYIGWNPKGKVFDQSIEGTKLKTPINAAQGLIPGWAEGVKGMKIGGVREITIPSDKAYGEQGSGDDIPPNTPIKFIIMAIPQPKPVPIPEALQGMY